MPFLPAVSVNHQGTIFISRIRGDEIRGLARYEEVAKEFVQATLEKIPHLACDLKECAFCLAFITSKQGDENLNPVVNLLAVYGRPKQSYTTDYRAVRHFTYAANHQLATAHDLDAGMLIVAGLEMKHLHDRQQEGGPAAYGVPLQFLGVRPTLPQGMEEPFPGGGH